MECNKEYAISAKSIAESRMQSKDFEGARKIALKAQRLFPDLESISQMLAVCEVYCAAGTRISGEIDWYGVLQVEMTADESTIRKQYLNLALLLHPDKNNLAGAGGAFQLIGDAYKTLSDPAKRSKHDIIRRGNFSRISLNQPAQQSYRPSAMKQPGPGVSSTAAKTNFVHFSGLNKYQSSQFSGTQAFWTICSSCSVRFQYYQNVLNKQVRCNKCFNIFVAYDLRSQGVPSTGNIGKVRNTAPFTGQKSDCINASTMGFEGPNSGDLAFNPGSNPEFNPEFCGAYKSSIGDGKVDDDLTKCNDMKFKKVQLQPIHNGEQVSKPPAWYAGEKRSRNEDDRASELNVGTTSNLPRRSNRRKQNVSYNEVQGVCIDSVPPVSKRSRQDEKQADEVKNKNVFPDVVDGDIEGNKNSYAHAVFSANIASRYQTSLDPGNLTYPAPEFCSFETERSQNKFAIDQIWALYNNIDGMPRFYARVRKVYSREFKLQLNWLENDPRSIAEMKWSEQDLPVACGSFKLGKSFNAMDQGIFSHLMPCRKGTRRNSYVIYPRSGEVWALFKNWDIKWSSDPHNHRVYEYQIVEVVSDFAEITGISVVRLAKIKEFMALFVRAADAEENLLEIPAKDVLMFSHRIPACRMTGKEEEGVPEGSFELDCASLPTNFTETFPSVNLESIRTRTWNGGGVCNNVFSSSVSSKQKFPRSTMENGFEHNEQNALEKRRQGTRGSASSRVNGTSGTRHINSIGSQNVSAVSKKDVEIEAENIASQNPNIENHTSSLDYFEYPESEFYDFINDRLMEKLEIGQVWALYCDIDSFPKFYGLIRNLDLENNKVHLRWLAACSAPDEDDHCAVEKPPAACGTFKTVKAKCTMDSMETFSHLVKAKQMMMRSHYSVFPEAGDVWAVFKNRSASWSVSDFQNSEFDIVEISGCDAFEIKTLLLTKVDGFVSVFRHDNEGRDAVKLIPLYECSRQFSHRIPAYQLTKEMDRGYWELDPASVPLVFLSSKS